MTGLKVKKTNVKDPYLLKCTATLYKKSVIIHGIYENSKTFPSPNTKTCAKQTRQHKGFSVTNIDVK